MTFDNKDPGSPMAGEDLISFPYDHTCCTVEKDVLFKMFQNRFGTGKHNDLGAPMFWKTIKNIIPGTTEPTKKPAGRRSIPITFPSVSVYQACQSYVRAELVQKGLNVYSKKLFGHVVINYL